MKVLASEIAQWVGGELVGEDRWVSGVSPIENAEHGDLCYTTSVKRPTSDGVLLCTAAHQGKTCVVVPSPRSSFGIVLQKLFPESHEPGISEKSHIHPSAIIGENVTVYPGVWIGADCIIGCGTIIFPNAVIYPGTVVGKNCRLHAGCVLGADGFSYSSDGDEIVKIPQLGRLRIGDDVEIGANACIDRAFLEETVVGSGSKIDNLVQIAHNSVLGKGVLVAAQSGIAGSSILEDGVQLGGQVGISDHSIIERGAKIAAKSGVHGRLAGGQSYFGIPALPRGKAFRLLRKLRQLIR